MSTAWKVVIVVALVVGVGVVVGLKQKEAPAVTPEPAASEVEEAVTTPAPTRAVPRLVDLGADKCIPCKMMAPILEELKTEYEGRLRVDFIDVWENPDQGQQYGIRLIPTQIFFDASGKELFRHEGFMSKEDILAKWKELGVDLSASAR